MKKLFLFLASAIKFNTLRSLLALSLLFGLSPSPSFAEAAVNVQGFIGNTSEGEELEVKGYIHRIVTCMDCEVGKPCAICSGDYFIFRDKLVGKTTPEQTLKIWFDPQLGLREGVRYRLKLRRLATKASGGGLQEAKLTAVLGME